jgi:carbonic anhydrase
MKNSTLILIIYSLLGSACHTDQQTKTLPADSLQKQAESVDSVQQKTIEKLTRAGDMVKAESPDAEVKFEQGYALPSANDGVAQSPINIITSGLHADIGHRSNLKFVGSMNVIENLGHTIQIDFTKGSVTMVGGQSYELKQLHFHTPSEHLINGITYPMEMHIVSTLNDSTKKGGSEYTVVGILFRMGPENKFLKEFLNSIPREEGKETLDSARVQLNNLFSAVPGGEKFTYYKYRGSLTTPPYSESVNWVIINKIFEASEEQIATIEKLEGNNARHIRALNNREIVVE